MVAELSVLDNPDALHGQRGFSPSGCDPNGRCGNGLEKIYPTCAVRYGLMEYVGEFKYAPNMLFACGEKVVIQTSRGIEIGRQVSLTCTGCDKSISRRQMLTYVKNSGADAYQLKAGRILRVATPQDLLEEARINGDAQTKHARARELAKAKNLPMKFVACEHLFGGERIVFHFMAESRIDFRELVRDLAHEYHTRIEMHQVGARDEARLVADYEICGRECCCKNFLKKLRPVNMRMAKLQKATLDPSKVSGRCGRLRCCLRYEHEGYEELNKKLPRAGTRVRTDRGVGTIRNRQVLTQLVTVLYDDTNQFESLGIEDVLETGLPKKPPPDQAPRGGGETSDRGRGIGRGTRPQGVDGTQARGGPQTQKVTPEAEARPGRRRRPPGGKPRRKETLRCSAKSDGSPTAAPTDDAPIGGAERGDTETAPSAGETTGPVAGGDEASRPTGSGTPPAPSGRRRRRGRGRGRRRRRGAGGQGPSGESASPPPSDSDEERRVDSPRRVDDRPPSDDQNETG